jgi:hypothetical protein
MMERAIAIAESLRAVRDRKVRLCAQACFCEADGKTVTPDGERLLADLRKHAKLFGTSIARDVTGKIDRDDMLRIEGRREIVLRLINLLELDPLEVARFVEVDNGQV